jgi:hypothetical protein
MLYSSSLPVALLPHPAPLHGDWPLMVRPMQRRCLCWHCAGVLALIALDHCQHYTCVVAGIAPALCWRCCAGIFALSCCYHCPCLPCVTTSRKLASTQSPRHCDPASSPALCWRLCWHRAGVLARITLASLPASHCHCHRRYAAVVPLVARVSPPCYAGVLALVAPRIAASVSNWCLPSPAAVMTRRRMWRCRRLLVIADGFVAIPASLHGNLAFDGPADAALASLPALRWRPCPHVAGIIASILLLSLPALRRCCFSRRAGVFALVLLALSISLHPRCRKHHELASASHNAVAIRWCT